jgi:amino acid adenylation domain-containing protein/thioester reductase-like protein
MKLSQQQQSLLEKLLREEGLSVTAQPVAGRRDGLNQYPLSYGQQRLWFLDQLEPGHALYNMPVAVRLVGEVDERVLSQVVNEVVRRHEVLRTTFTTIDGMPVQRIASEREIHLPVEDITDLPEEVRERRAHELAQAEAQMPFDLMTGPLLRVRLLRLTPTEHIVLFTMHHIVADGWSMSVLIREVVELYTAFVKQRPSPLPELAIQYADYAVWQRQWLSGPLLQQQLTYWTEHLAGAPTVLNLPTDRPRPSTQRYRGATHSFIVAASTVTGLYQVGLRAHATLFMTLAAALNVLLARYSGQNDICLGTPIANRTRAELEPLIGFFVNTLVLRTQIDHTQPFLTLLEQVRTTALNAYAHQDIPFEYVVEVLNPERHLSHTPLFQVMLVLQNAPLEKLELPGLTLSSMQIESTTAQFDLTVDLVEANGQLYGTVGYNKDLFEAATIGRMTNHYIQLLEAIVAEPTVPVRELAMLSTAERVQLLLEWNATVTDSPAAQTIQELFEAQVERTPEAVAVVYEDQQLTYRELNARANQLARYLCAAGVGPDALVGLCVERSLEMIVGVLGILKAGGAYVPLDPTYPMERLRYVLADSRPVVLLTRASLCAMLPMTEIPTLCLDTQWTTVTTEPTENLLHQPLPQHLAYVIYTSGSTGNVKGVVVTHANVAHSTMARVVKYREEPSSFLLLSSIAFDSSVAGIFGTLAQGGQLVLSAAGEGLEPGILWELIYRHKVSHLLTVPSFYRLLLEHMPVTKGPSLRSVILAGEACGSDLLAKHRSLLPGVRFFNEYGPTEATVWSTVHEGRDWESTPTVPIGRPIANTQMYILDGDFGPVPVGVAGELYIAGVGLARGYLRRPNLTAEKFIPNPFSQEPGARMYKSGDLARYLSDGNIEYLGRLDQQVKIRGFRVELGEIEAAIQALPGVREAVVLVREDNPDDKRLVAYVVAKSGTEPMDTGALRSRLAQTLPAYMVPTAIVLLDQFPLTPNGKLDRKALPVPKSTRGTERHVSPRTPTEASLAEIWAAVLQLDQVGGEDNFFELGGHSLLAARLLSQIQAVLQVEVPLRAVFEAPTVSGLARLIEAIRDGHPMSKDPSIDLAAEAVLPADVTPAWVSDGTIERAIRPAQVFLTGATGFLGAYLLRDLLEMTSASIHCLVRGTGPEEGWLKLRRNLETYGLWKESYQPRIRVCIGDLSRPLLGLPADTFDRLAGLVDVVYHNGARLDLTQSYFGLKAENVFGTQEVLRLASRRRAKPVHYVSTVSVFDPGNLPAGRVIREADEIDPSADLQDGYSQSKWVAERLVQLAGRRGLPVSIYRPGAVSGDSRTGAWKTDDFVCRMIKGCILLGKAPDIGHEVNLVPVDYVSRAIVMLSFNRHSVGKAFHLVNPHPGSLEEFVAQIRSRGYLLEVVPERQWRAELVATVLRDHTHPLTPLRAVFEGGDETESDPGETGPRFDCQNVIDGLKDTTVSCPPVDAALVDTYFRYFEASGFLPAPKSACGHE